MLKRKNPLLNYGPWHSATIVQFIPKTYMDSGILPLIIQFSKISTHLTIMHQASCIMAKKRKKKIQNSSCSFKLAYCHVFTTNLVPDPSSGVGQPTLEQPGCPVGDLDLVAGCKMEPFPNITFTPDLPFRPQLVHLLACPGVNPDSL